MRQASCGAWLACLCLVGPGAVNAQALPDARTDEPRAYGYTVGSVVQRRVLLQLPPGWALDLTALPRTRRPGQAVELRSAELQGSTLLLDYQVFLAPTEVRTLELPSLLLRLTGPERGASPGQPSERELRVEAWPVTVSPLVPVDVSPREGLGAMRPDVPAPPIDTAPHRWRLAAAAMALAAIGLALLHLHVGLPFTARRQRPFARAWRELAALPDDAPPDITRNAMKRLHQALNDSAGQVLFAAGLPAFLARQPHFQPVQRELQTFFDASQAQFFAAAPAPAPEMRDIKRLCRWCLQAEQGNT